MTFPILVSGGVVSGEWDILPRVYCVPLSIYVSHPPHSPLTTHHSTTPPLPPLWLRSTDRSKEYLFKDIATRVQLLVGQVQGGQQAQDRSMRAVDEQLPLQALVNDAGRVHGQFDADHGSL